MVFWAKVEKLKFSQREKGEEKKGKERKGLIKFEASGLPMKCHNWRQKMLEDGTKSTLEEKIALELN